MQIQDVVRAFEDETRALESMWAGAPLEDVPMHYIRLAQESVNRLHNSLRAVVEYLAARDGYDDPGPSAAILEFPPQG